MSGRRSSIVRDELAINLPKMVMEVPHIVVNQVPERGRLGPRDPLPRDPVERVLGVLAIQHIVG